MKQYILLDWDGNLAKTLDVWLQACRAPLEKRGLTLTDEEVARCFGMPVERFTEWGITDIDDAIDEMDEMAVRLLPDVELYPDALEVLESFKKLGKKTALITTSGRSKVIQLLDKYDMHHYFDVIVAHEDTKQHKPHPEPLEFALQKLGGNIKDSIMIGDSDKDIGAANNAGIDSILFYPDKHRKFYNLSELEKLKPTYIVEDFRQILDII